MHRYRTHLCNDLSADVTGEFARLSGWIHRMRDHGGLLFVDLRDHYGISQCVITAENPKFEMVGNLPLESVLTVTGEIVARSEETVNPNLPTGDVELIVNELEVLSTAAPLPIPINSDSDYPETTRLTYRYLDLRRPAMHERIVLRSRIIQSIRERMIAEGFLEMHTPILTSSSPEGARDYLVPSRLHRGMFYALPQAPQIFKQLLMVGGFDRYFQIAPCFRDEEARADRSPGEFYQLDIEMAFVEQEDIFAVSEKVMSGVFDEFSEWKTQTSPYPRIKYTDAILRYGSDKPDLRNPLFIEDVTAVFAESDFKVFRSAIEGGAVVRAIRVEGVASKSRSFFDRLNDHARSLGAGGLAYITFVDSGTKGPVAKSMSEVELGQLRERMNAKPGDAVFMICDRPTVCARYAGQIRNHIGSQLDLVEKDTFRICWVVDFPMFELDEETGEIGFCHNPFSMPQGGLEALNTQDPTDVLAYQYDLVCNGVELCSGAIRNHLPAVMFRAFEIAGYPNEEVKRRFSSLIEAFQFGAPPHGGLAPGIDRIVMLIADEPNIREVIGFPMNQQAQDLMMKAPGEVSPEQLKELNIRVIEEGHKRPRIASGSGAATS